MKKVLLVDDVKLFLEIERSLLNRPGIEIFTATSGEEALEIHSTEKVDLILLDLYMPGITGDEVCRRIRSDDNLKQTSIIMVTTSTVKDDIERSMNAGANDYILKPINPIDLLQKIQIYMNVSMRKDVRILVRLGVEGRMGMESFIGNTANISTSGILIECAHMLFPGNTISCAFSLPGNTSPLSVTGEIVRKSKGRNPGMKAYGIKFLDILEEDVMAIKSFMARHPTQQTFARQNNLK